MKDIILPLTCKQLGMGLMILPLILLLYGIFTPNVVATGIGAAGTILDAVILIVLFIQAYDDGTLPRFPIRCKCND